MHTECSIYRTSSFMGKKWTMPILIELYKGRSGWKRYSHIKNRIQDITPKVLSARLKELERENMVIKRIDAKRFPVKCEYSLTESGEDFIRIIRHTKRWALIWKFNNASCRNTNCRDCEL